MTRLLAPGPETVAVRAAVPQEQRGPGRAARGDVVGAERSREVARRVAALQLEKLGCHVEVASNGIEAVEMATRLHFDVNFLDCQMPEMDGYEATAEIRRREAGGRHVPIVAMTAHAMAGDRDRCLVAGMDDYLAKPVRLPDLKAALRRWASPTPDQTRRPANPPAQPGPPADAD